MLTLTATDGTHRGSDSVIVRVGESLHLTLRGENDGHGTVTDDLGGSCTLGDENPQACELLYAIDSVVTLSAAPADGATFLGWAGACKGTGSCEVTMDDTQEVVAPFSGPVVLSVGIGGVEDGAGAVRIDPPGVLCEMAAGPCHQAYAYGDTVTLTALPAPGSVFVGWSEPECAGAGTGPCVVTMDTNQVVGATFLGPRLLHVGIGSQENGAGAVRIDPPNVLCEMASSPCVRPYTQGDTVTLTALPAPGSVFLGWSQPECPNAGTGPCVLTMDAHMAVGATFLHVNQPPSLSLLTPTPGALFVAPATVMLSADASDPDGTVARVEFFEGSTSLGFDATSPYAVTWSDVAAGIHTLTAVATDDRGATAAVPFTVTVSAAVPPAADAQVRDGIHADTNYGDAPTLEVRRNASSGATRWTYLRFPISALATVSGARLRLHGRLTERTGTLAQADLLAVADTAWVEDALTWNDKPPAQPTPIASTALVATATAERWYEWDVTAYVQAEKAAGHDVVSFALVEAANGPLATFRSRTTTDTALQPALLLTP